MATKEDSSIGDAPEQTSGSVHFWAEPGAKVKITVDVGNELVAGKVPLTVRIEQALNEPVEEALQGQQLVLETPRPARRSLHVPAIPSSRLRSGWETLKSRVRIPDLALWLFIAAAAIYLITRLVGLTQFPIYFFTDEAIQSLSVIDLIQNAYRDPNGVFLPTYFRNGEYYNISLSVYLLWLPPILFGKSAVATRAMSVLVTLLAAISLGLMLRDIFKLKYWWTGVLFLSITPAWFLHSRTAFESAEFVAIYSGALCAYLYYRHRSARYLYLAFVLGALAFYSYSPAQVIVPLTALGLLLSG